MSPLEIRGLCPGAYRDGIFYPDEYPRGVEIIPPNNLIECGDCDGLGGFPCQHCSDENQCVHFDRCEHCNGTGQKLIS